MEEVYQRCDEIVADIRRCLPDMFKQSKYHLPHGATFLFERTYWDVRKEDELFPMSSIKFDIYPSAHKDGTICATYEMRLNEAGCKLVGRSYPSVHVHGFTREASGQAIQRWWDEALAKLADIRAMLDKERIAKVRKKRMESYGGVCSGHESTKVKCGTNFCSEEGL